ncbi:chorismate--pyruvate lyase family protein [Alishewanella sp. HL-SH05]|uniref:chorismate--pyruvate lyase family protein n=1 Tax=Alishewanella sp. HL-SH05 TaxID=3461145 RepID=UPI004042D9C7
MSVVLSLEEAWQHAATSLLPTSLAPWLLESGSLTARLKAHSTSFRLQVIAETAAVLPHFLQASFPKPVQQCVCREVLMWCNEQPVVYAQSWLPKQSMQHIQALVALGEQPLGELLFQFDDVSRSAIEVAQLALTKGFAGVAPGHFWARRSVFSVAEQPLLVAEVFLPGVLNL